MAATGKVCPACDGAEVRVFYEVENIPVNSVLQLDSREEALAFPTGDMALGHCATCGFVYNTAYDASRLEYSNRYEETQSSSAVFRTWHEGLARDLIERHGLAGKRIIEIGCGKGEFLRMLCEAGGNHGLGFDPSYVAGRDGGGKAQVEFIADFYGPKYADRHGDFVCCKMTLEHIPRVRDFVGTVRQTVGDGAESTVMFQVPDAQKVLADCGFWDIYYEHCSYFHRGSLARLFRRAGFDVKRIERAYDGQYLMLDCVASRGKPTPPLPEEDDLQTIHTLVERFEERIEDELESWARRLEGWKREGKKVVVWSSSSKATAFLTTLPGSDVIEWVVDINPRRQGHYMAGGGQQIVGPDFLVDYVPDIVVIMNPIYREEIAADLRAKGLEPELLTT